ncbi:MAG: hypothetical protein HGA42_14550 [Nostocales cyanobacterium W4_Combined_metabat2_030]|nr:hypothetical protein [Nostocales cyanobacterium W4_Combined_metabat2_030]
MTHTRRSLTCRQSQLFRSLIATAFIANGFFPFVAPALAEGTKAGQTISNTATATYNDPNNPGTTLNTTSNPVVVTVAEVAGITISNVGVVDSTPADVIKVGDTLTYTFAIKNVGNDPTRFRIPNLATTTGPVVAGNLSYSINGSYTQIPGTEVITSSIPVGGTVLVQVPVTVQAGANASDPINVKIGDTPNNAQNVLRVNNGGDVYTVDNPDAPTIIDEIPGVPINGTREASNTQTSTVGNNTSPPTNNMSLATLLKTNTYSNNSTTNSITDDTITYNLSLRVEGSDVTGLGITPQPLTGYAGITVDSVANKNYILVSDVIPAGTVLSAVPTNVPNGWTPVYSTAPASGVKPQDVVWTTTAPAAALGTVTRVGFVKETPTAGDNITAGTTVTGFAIPLAITGTPTTLTINSIAQLVGQTPGAGGLPVYDESGDQNPSNYSGPVGNMTPGAASTNAILPTNAAAVLANIIDGVANPITQGIDTNNNNTGTGPGGEDNQLIISVATTPTTGVLNGPEGKADATGPDGTNNTDFTNKSSFIPAGTSPGSTIDPAPVKFSNTVQNDTGATAVVTLAPTVPANKFDLPTGTKVTITNGDKSAVYQYSQTAAIPFTLISANPISIPNVATGATGTVNYGVEVDLPAGTKLSTDTLPDYTGDTEWGYPVPITATIGNATNITIDRVYTGFLQLLKFSRILKGTGPDVIGNQGSYNSTPAYTNPATGLVIDPDPTVADEARTPYPGNIIQYEIRYKNISTAQGTGTNNVILQAQNVVITEDGTLSTVPGDGKNNWAKDNDSDGIIDTSNMASATTATITVGTTTSNTTATVTTTPAGDVVLVTKYVNSPTGSIAPQDSGTLNFQRKLN